jgi:hypothetical protein
MAREFKGARYALGEPVTSDLIAYCEAEDKVPIKVIRRAVEEYLERRKRPRKRRTKRTE